MLNQKITDILFCVQSCGGTEESSAAPIPNTAVAETLINAGVRLLPVTRGDFVYVVQRYPKRCANCEFGQLSSGCCLHECEIDFRILTVLVDDVSLFCRITQDGNIELKPGIFKTKAEAQQHINEKHEKGTIENGK